MLPRHRGEFSRHRSEFQQHPFGYIFAEDIQLPTLAVRPLDKIVRTLRYVVLLIQVVFLEIL